MCFAKMHTYSKQRNKSNSSFSYKITANSDKWSDSLVLGNGDKIEQITSSYAENLFQKLQPCRKSGLFSSEVIAVYTGVKST